jgi:uncharacterized protein
MKSIFYIAAFISLLLFTVNKSVAQSKSTDKKEIKAKGEMRTYYMVFLKKGPKRDHDSTTAAKIQAGHMANMDKLAKEGKLAIAGPFLDDTDLRGIFIFTADNAEEVAKWVETDPAIISGRLIYEVHPWMSMRGASLP